MHLGPMWSYEVSENISATANANESCFSLDIISQALHETLGDNIPLVSAENSLPMLETVKDTSAASQRRRNELKVWGLNIRAPKVRAL